MIGWKELRQRRIVRIVGAYIAGGWVAVAVVGEVVDRAILPELFYRVTLTLFLVGIPAALILGWFHGEKGHQRVTKVETTLLAGIAIIATVLVRQVIVGAQIPSSATAIDSALSARQLAVLYFEDQSRDGQLRYVADGLTEGLIDQLGRVERLEVVSANGSRLYAGSKLARDSIARALGVGTLIEGVVEGDSSVVRVTVRLVDGESGARIEDASIELPTAQVLALQDSIAVEIARDLRTWLGEEINVRQRRGGTSNVAAWALVRRGERVARDAESVAAHEGWDHVAPQFAVADSLFAQAESLDASWVEPIVARGTLAYRRSRNVHEPAEVVRFIDEALGHAERAMAIDGSDAKALELRGTARYWRWLFGAEADPVARTKLLDDAEADLRRALERAPSLASAYSTLGHLYYQKDPAEAILATRRAYEEDAYLEVADGVLWRLYTGSYDLSQFAQARRWCDEGHRRFPEDYRFVECQLWLMTTPIGSTDPVRARTLQAELLAVTPEPLRAYQEVLSELIIGGVYARAGAADSAEAVLGRARARVDFQLDPQQELVSIEAFMRVLNGQPDEAIRLLTRYVAANPEHFHVDRAVSWWWRDLQGLPEFQSLLSSH